MSVVASLQRQVGSRAVRPLSALFLLLALILWPQPAQANVVCSLANEPVTISFGSSLTASAEIRYTCRSFDSTPTSFTICAAMGTPSFPGTAQQPVMQGSGGLLNFNLYVDQAATTVWTRTNPIAQNATVPAGGTISGTLPFYGRIPAGQTSPVGSYQAFIFNTTLGFLPGGSTNCSANLGQLNGLDFTLFVNAVVAEACNLGTIEAIDFGTPAGLWTRADAAGSVQVSCPSNLRWTLQFGAGLHAMSGERRMQSSEGNYVSYRLYRDSGRAQPIPIDATITGTGNGAVQSVPVYGRVEVLQPPPVGNYADTVIVVLSF